MSNDGFVNCLGTEQQEMGSMERVRTYSDEPSQREYIPRPRERRIPRTSHQVMEKMQRLADEQHGGALRENVIEIFEQLHPVDRQTFLKKSLILHWESAIDRAKEALEDIPVDRETSIDMGVVQHERKDLSAVDAEEQIKLKTWMNKAFFVTGVTVFVLASVFVFVFGNMGGDKTSTMMDILLNIIDVAKG